MTRPSAQDPTAAPLWPEAPPGDDSRVPWVWLSALTLLALALRLIGLDQQLWYDEMATLLESVRQPLATIFTTYSSQNQHTLYSVLARGTILLFGDHPWTLRLPAALFGVASIPALYFCARLMTTRREALLASALLTVSYHHVWFSQNARGYTGLVFFTLLATFFFLRGAQGGGIASWVGYGLALALGIYVHLTMAAVAAGHGLVYLWLLAARTRRLRRLPAKPWLPLIGFAIGGALTILLYAPVLPAVTAGTVGQVSRWTDPYYFVVETLRGLSTAVGGHLAPVALGGLILLAGLVSHWRKNRYALGLMIFPGIVTALLVLFLAHHQPRFFFFAIGFAFLLLARGAMLCGATAARLLQRNQRAEIRWGTVLMGLILLGSAWSLRPAYLYPKQDFLGAMAFVDAERQPGDTVVAAGLAALPFRRYYDRDWLAVENLEQLDAVRAQGRRAWLLYTLPVFERWMHPDLWNAIQKDFSTVRVFPGTLSGGEIYVCRPHAQPSLSGSNTRKPRGILHPLGKLQTDSVAESERTKTTQGN